MAAAKDDRRVNWQEIFDLHVTKRLRQILRRRFASELGFVSASGEIQAGVRHAEPCAAQAWRSIQAQQALVSRSAHTKYVCPAHDRIEIAAPITILGKLIGCAFVTASTEPATELKIDEEFLAEILELQADEVISFWTESALRDQHGGAPGDFTPRYSYDAIVGRCRPMQDLYRMLDKIIESNSTVLVQGENGTGKELIARAIHYNSPRSVHRFVVQNCSAFNDNLLDSELFGHQKGSFTGAIADKQGLFEVADRGTFFLDEIGDMSPALQVKVLRVLQEGTFTPVGGTEPRQVDVRIIAATNRDLKKMVERGEFREDLYYRVNVINLTAPALRDRRDDIPLLVEHFLKQKMKGKTRYQQPKQLASACLDRLLRYQWPGNIRELENEIERLVVLSGDDAVIQEEMLSPRILEPTEKSLELDGEGGTSEAHSLNDAVDSVERDLIYEVLKRTDWNKTKAAAELQISRRNLIRKVIKYRLDSRRQSSKSV